MKKALFLLIMLCGVLARAADDQPDLATRLTERFMHQLSQTPDGQSGEPIAWYWAYSLGSIMQGCKNWPTDTWMAPTEKALHAMVAKMAKGPDGYMGFIGPYIYNQTLWADVHVGDSILIKPMLTFAEIVHDNPALKEKYGESAKKFIGIARRDLIEKWEKRGTFHVDGPFAGYREWNMYCNPDDIAGEWFADEAARHEGRPPMSIPFNKAMDMGVCMLQLYRITGEAPYREKAEKIFNRFKAGINRFDGACTWNYWEPIAPKDILDLNAPDYKILTHWVGTHAYRDYQAGELAHVVYAYNMGVTFTEDDMKRFVATNLRFMWNGDKENPKWVNSTSTLPGYKQAEPSKAYPTWAGCVWSALAPFDATIRDLSAKALPTDDIVAQTAFKKLCETPVSYVRTFRPDAKVEDFPWMSGIKESKGQMFAAAVPSVVGAGKTTVLFAKTDAPRSEARIYARPLAGGERALFTTIPKMGDGVQFAYEWDCTIDGKRTPGEYVIIWEYMGGERAYPLTIK